MSLSGIIHHSQEKSSLNFPLPRHGTWSNGWDYAQGGGWHGEGGGGEGRGVEGSN